MYSCCVNNIYINDTSSMPVLRTMPCPFGLVTPFLVVRHAGLKFFKLVWIIAYSIQKELCKNFQPFSYNNFLTKYGRGPATPL